MSDFAAIYNFVEQSPGTTRSSVAATFGMTTSTLDTKLVSMVGKGMVVCEDKDCLFPHSRGGQPSTWFLEEMEDEI